MRPANVSNERAPAGVPPPAGIAGSGDGGSITSLPAGVGGSPLGVGSGGRERERRRRGISRAAMTSPPLRRPPSSVAELTRLDGAPSPAAPPPASPGPAGASAAGDLPLARLRVGSQPSDPGGGDQVAGTPPCAAALRGSLSRSLSEAVSAPAAAASVSATVGGRGGAPDDDGLAGGEASWWAAASGSVYPDFRAVPPHAASEPFLWRDLLESAPAVGADPLLAAFVASVVGDADDLADAVAAVVAGRLDPGPAAEPGSTPPMMPRHKLAAALRAAVAEDVAAAHYRRPPPRPSLAETVLFHDGLHALSAQRASHALWAASRRGAALALQARASAVLGADLHPAAKIAPGVLLVHPLGVVIGEAAVVGPGVVICHGVTLGGTGKVGEMERVFSSLLFFRFLPHALPLLPPPLLRKPATATPRSGRMRRSGCRPRSWATSGSATARASRRPPSSCAPCPPEGWPRDRRRPSWGGWRSWAGICEGERGGRARVVFLFAHTFTPRQLTHACT